jgi:hypothetical protein
MLTAIKKSFAHNIFKTILHTQHFTTLQADNAYLGVVRNQTTLESGTVEMDSAIKASDSGLTSHWVYEGDHLVSHWIFKD